jgi:hypothetical protein
MNKSDPIALTESTYFSPAAESYYMGSTQYKRFLKCESQALAVIRGEYVPETSTALLVGSYIDSHFSRTLDVFKAQRPEIFLKSGGLKSDYEYANYIIARIERDNLMMQALSGQSQVIMTGEIEGVPVKIKIDSLLPDRTVDLKITKDFDSVWSDEDGCRVPWWKAWRYDIQAALYQYVRARNEDGEIKPFSIAGATKEKPEPDIGLFDFSQSILDAAMDEIRANIVYFDGLKKGLYEPTECGECAWCRSQKVLTGWEEIS